MRLRAIMYGAVLATAVSATAYASESFVGYLDEHPADGGVGTWVVRGESFEATEATEIKATDGPLEAGACVEVMSDGGMVKSIATIEQDRCKDGS